MEELPALRRLAENTPSVREGLRQESGRRIRCRSRDGRSQHKRVESHASFRLEKGGKEDDAAEWTSGDGTAERFFDYVTLSHLRQGR